MAKKDPYSDFLKQDFAQVFSMLNLSDLNKHFLTSRWLEQVLWMEKQAGRARNRYYNLRLSTIIGGVILPALVSLNINNTNVRQTIVLSTFFLSQVVAISAAVEEFFHYGDRWRHYRRTSESLKTQGWQFFQLSGPYINYKTHEQAFSVFASQVEDIVQRDVEVYATQIVQENKKENNGENAKNGKPETVSVKSEVSPK